MLLRENSIPVRNLSIPALTTMTYYCSECVVNWWPYQARDGCCPSCGGGTSRRQEPASDDVDLLFARARKEAERRERHAAFEAYYAERGQHAA
jgi:hypothetical protein